jgi:hypothetical protein
MPLQANCLAAKYFMGGTIKRYNETRMERVAILTVIIYAIKRMVPDLAAIDKSSAANAKLFNKTTL